MKYIDLFGGIGGFSFGIEQATKGKFECVYYNDFDKYAVQTYNKNFGTDYEATDITTVKEADIPDHDLICGGFPCQTFSIAGKRRGFKDTRGTLFFEIMRIAKAKGTPYLFLENVKGLLNHEKGKTFRTILQTLQELGYEYQWMVLNSKFFGVAQNRERVFIIANLRGTPRPEILPFRENPKPIQELSKNKEVEKIGMNWIQRGAIFNKTPHTGQPQPVPEYDRIYQTNGISPPVKRETKILTLERKDFREHKNSGTPTLKNRMGTGGNNVPMVMNLQTRSATRPSLLKNPKAGGSGTIGKVNETYCLDSNNSQGVGIVAMRGRNPKNPSDRTPGSPTEQRLEANSQGISNTLSTIQKDNLVLKNKLRRLTPKECERLQGYPDDWTAGVSDTQRYKQLGNAVTVTVIEEIVKSWNQGKH